MHGIPALGRHGNRGIRIGCYLRPQRSMLRGRNGPAPPSGALRCEVGLRPAQGHPAGDGCYTDPKGGGNLGTRQAAINRGQYALA